MVDSLQVPVQATTSISYRQHLKRSGKIGPCKGTIINVMGSFGLFLLIVGIGGLFKNFNDASTKASFVTIGIGAFFLISFAVTHCIAYNSYINTSVVNPGHSLNPNTAGSPTPYMGSSSPSVSSPPTYEPGPGFTHDHDLSTPMNGSSNSYPPPPPYEQIFSSKSNYSPSSPTFSDSATAPPPPLGFSGQQGTSAYPPVGFSGQQRAYSGQSGVISSPSDQPGIAPPPYDLSTPFAPKGSIFSYS